MERWLISGYGEKGRNAAVFGIEDGVPEILYHLDTGAKPSWSLIKGDLAYIVDGTSMERHGMTGHVDTFRLFADHADKLSSVAVGDNPVSLAISPDGDFLAVADYLSGDTCLLSLDGNGIPHPYQRISYGDDASRPHAVLFAKGKLFTADLGMEAVHVHGAIGGTFRHTADLALPAGTGPRALLDGKGDILYVLGENDSRLHTVDTASGEIISSVRTTAREGTTYAGSMARLGDRIIVSNRVTDTYALIDPEKGLISENDTVDYPRFLDILSGRLFILGQKDSMVEARDPETGDMMFSMCFPSPVAISSLHIWTR